MLKSGWRAVLAVAAVGAFVFATFSSALVGAIHTSQASISPTVVEDNVKSIFHLTIVNEGPNTIENIDITLGQFQEAIGGASQISALRSVYRKLADISVELERVSAELKTAAENIRRYGGQLKENIAAHLLNAGGYLILSLIHI